MRRLLSYRTAGLLALLLLAFPLSARAQLATLTVQGVDGLLDTARYGLKMVGHEDQAKQLDGLLEAFLQGEGFKGIDTKKPFGLFIAKVPENPQKPPVVGFIPITKDKEFIDLLGRVNITPSKEENGVRSVEIPNGQRLYLRFEHNHVFIAQDGSDLKSVPNPASFTKSASGSTLFHLNINFDEVPDELKKKFLAGIDNEINKQKNRQDGEQDHEYQGRLAGMKLTRDAFVSLVKDSARFTLQVDLDQIKHQFSIESHLLPKPGTALAKELQGMNQSKTSFAGLLDAAPASLAWHGLINDQLRGEMNKLIDNAFAKAIEQEKSGLKKAVAEKVFKALEPTLKSNVIDFAASLRGNHDGQPLTGILALRVKNGKQLEQLARDFTADLKEKDRQHIKLDADKVGDVNLHVAEGPAQDDKGKEIEQVFGAMKFTLAFHDDAVFLALGKNSLEEVKAALAGLGKSSTTAPVQLEFHGRAFTRFEKNQTRRKAMDKALSEPGSDLIRLAVTGGDSFKFRLQVSSHYLKLAKTLQEKGE